MQRWDIRTVPLRVALDTLNFHDSCLSFFHAYLSYQHLTPVKNLGARAPELKVMFFSDASELQFAGMTSTWGI